MGIAWVDDAPSRIILCRDRKISSIRKLIAPQGEKSRSKLGKRDKRAVLLSIHFDALSFKTIEMVDFLQK